MLRGAYGYGTCLSKLVSHPFFTNHTYGTQEEEDYSYIYVYIYYTHIISIILTIDTIGFFLPQFASTHSRRNRGEHTLKLC